MGWKNNATLCGLTKKKKIVLEFFAVGDKRTALLFHPVKGGVTNQYITWWQSHEKND
jgi:hypothetical protein